MPAPTRTDVFCFLLFLGAQISAFELWAILTRGLTISQAVWDWSVWLPWLETVVGLALLVLWLHWFRHAWLVWAWDKLMGNG